jgi:ATP-dependent HslUV protease subunit HslV
VSTIAVVKKHGTVAIAADTLTTFGTRKVSAVHNRQPSKILRLGASFVGFTGWSVHMQVLERIFRTMSEPPPLSSVTDIFEVLLALHPRLKQEYFLVPRGDEGDAYEPSHLNLVIANAHGIFGAYSMRDVLEYERFWASGSGSSYALGAMQAVYDGPHEALSIAEAAVRAAIEFDESTGGPVESYVVSPAAARAAEDFDLLLKV